MWYRKCIQWDWALQLGSLIGCGFLTTAVVKTGVLEEGEDNT